MKGNLDRASVDVTGGALVLLAALWLTAGCGKTPTPAAGAANDGAGGDTALPTPVIAVELPEEYNTPDGMALDAEGNIILSCPNFNDDSYPAKLLKIDPLDGISELVTLPPYPVTGKVGPLGIAVGADGHIYVADNQSDFTEIPSSRLLRVRMGSGVAIRCETLVEGFVQANAVCCRGDQVWVTETRLRPAATPLVSGVYRFALTELDGRRPLRIVPGGADPHLVTTVETKNPHWRVGANGMDFDAAGNLFFCNFGDAQILRVILDDDGQVASQIVFAEGQGMESTDGLEFDPVSGDFFVADFAGNAVHRVDGKTGQVIASVRNGDTDGRNGELDRPSEVCLRGNRLYVSNIDLPYGGNEYDAPHTVSVIELNR